MPGMRVCGSGLSLGLADLDRQVFQLSRNTVEESKSRNLGRLSSRRNREFSRQSAEITGHDVSIIARNPLLFFRSQADCRERTTLTVARTSPAFFSAAA